MDSDKLIASCFLFTALIQTVVFVVGAVRFWSNTMHQKQVFKEKHSQRYYEFALIIAIVCWVIFYYFNP